MQVGGWFSPQHPRPSLVFLVRACGREQERLLFTRCLAPTYIPTYLRVDALPVQIDGSQSGVCPSVQRCVGRALARGGWRAGCMACVDYHTHTPHAGTDTSGVGGGGVVEVGESSTSHQEGPRTYLPRWCLPTVTSFSFFPWQSPQPFIWPARAPRSPSSVSHWSSRRRAHMERFVSCSSSSSSITQTVVSLWGRRKHPTGRECCTCSQPFPSSFIV